MAQYGKLHANTDSGTMTSATRIATGASTRKACEGTQRQHTQPAWSAFTSVQEARSFADEIGYPVLVRPSYVLSGAAMKVAYGEDELEQYLRAAADVSKEYAVVMTKFIPNAKDCDFMGESLTAFPLLLYCFFCQNLQKIPNPTPLRIF